MQNSVCKKFALATAFLLALSGAAIAGDNAGVVIGLGGDSEISDVGAGASVEVAITAAGMVGVKQFDVTLQVSPADAFDLSGSATFAPAAPFTISPGVEYPADGEVKSGAASFGGAADGDGALGAFTLKMAEGFNADTEATITVSRVSLGPSSSERDVFEPALVITVNPPPPPVTEPTLEAVTATDVSLDYSAVGQGDTADDSDGELVIGATFTDGSGEAVAGQAFTWSIMNNGSESVFLIGVGEIAAGADITVDAETGADGAISATFDAEADRSAGTTSLSVSISTTAANSAGESRDLSLTYSATWDVAVAAELASLTSSVTVDKDILLSWDVASQTNNLGWEVYRSIDGRAYTKISDMILGDGNSDEFLVYSFLDDEAPNADVLFYYLNQTDVDGSTTRSQVVEVDLLAPSTLALPTVTALRQNFPNPFNPETTIDFDLSSSETVHLTIYDVTGQVVRTLVDGQPLNAGTYKRVWDGRNSNGMKVASGVYFFQMRAGDFVDKRKMTLLQ
uniref:FlgD/Vpr Ig-like domain-containing protein n=1 Tax=uncultured bacterium HF0130_06E03 TaxID=710813 RepID=E0XSX9_9BACT|nr:hypothetical protein [uncultured bacterium HF0130_06E03]